MYVYHTQAPHAYQQWCVVCSVGIIYKTGARWLRFVCDIRTSTVFNLFPTTLLQHVLHCCLCGERVYYNINIQYTYYVMLCGECV